MKHREKFILSISFLIFCFFLNSAYSQRDTVRIFYKGMQTEVVDSNYNKISEWAKKLNGKRFNVEINAYYDVSDFRNAMTERAENVQTVVIRKSRDFTTIRFAGAVKGKKSQRSYLNIIYWPEGDVEVSPAAKKENKNNEDVKSPKDVSKKENKKLETKNAEPDKKEVLKPKKEKEKNIENDRYANAVDSGSVNKAQEVTKRKEKKPKTAPSSEISDKKDPETSSEKNNKEKSDKQEKYVTVTDSFYVNGVMKVTKRKEKRQDSGK